MDWQTDVAPVVASMIRHGLTAVAGVLATEGWISKDQQVAFVSAGLAVAAWAGALAWSIVQKRMSKAAVVAASVTGNPTS